MRDEPAAPSQYNMVRLESTPAYNPRLLNDLEFKPVDPPPSYDQVSAWALSNQLIESASGSCEVHGSAAKRPPAELFSSAAERQWVFGTCRCSTIRPTTPALLPTTGAARQCELTLSSRCRPRRKSLRVSQELLRL